MVEFVTGSKGRYARISKLPIAKYGVFGQIIAARVNIGVSARSARLWRKKDNQVC